MTQCDFRLRRLIRAIAAALLLLLLPALLVACDTVERAQPRPRPSRSTSGFTIRADPIMRGTIASEAILDGYEPVVVRGFGLVVGLDGTGSRDLPPSLRAHMIAEMGKLGIGSPSHGYGHLEPEMMLNSMDTAVVIVEGIIPPGSKKGTTFDIRVYADPRTGTTSLEGGRLYTTDLRPGRLTTGSGQSFPLAQAGGPLFINPFAEPGAIGRDTVVRTAARILGGGMVQRDMPMKLRLASPSHSRSQILTSAINARFPQERGQRDQTARGESDSSIEITVPPSYLQNPEEFVELLRHTSLRLSNPEGIATSVRRLVLSDPSLGPIAVWRWRALGPRVQPIIKELYDHPEELPRMAALEAGAKLDDPLVIPHLIDAARNPEGEYRAQAIDLLAELRLNPRIDHALRDLLNDPDGEVRLRAYEALAVRGDPSMERHLVDQKFILDVVESDYPTVYITQAKQPRIVIFGRDLEIKSPMLFDAWSNRLMIKSDYGQDFADVFYRPAGGGSATVLTAPLELPEFIRFLGHSTSVDSPEPGLDLTYAETVGALHQIWRDEYLPADFKAEQERIIAAILELEQNQEVERRPEFLDDGEEAEQQGEPLDFGPDLGRRGGEGDATPSLESDLDRLPPPMSRHDFAASDPTSPR